MTPSKQQLQAGLSVCDWEYAHVCRSHLQRMLWLSDSHAGGSTALLDLRLAFLRRVARDPSILTLTSAEVMGLGKNLSRHKGCHGCPSCNGPGWEFKAGSVAAIWTMCCKPLTHVCQSNSLHTMMSVVVPSPISLSQVVTRMDVAPPAPDSPSTY